MRKILAIIVLAIAGVLNAQVSGQAITDIDKYGYGGNSTKWVQETVFIDAGATRIGPFSCDQPPIGMAVTRNAVWDSITATPSDDYHWDSSWTASDFSFLFGFESVLNDSARAIFTPTNTYDFLPVYEDSATTTRFTVQADSMRYILLPEIKMAGAKYMYIEFYDSVGDSLVPQAASRRLVLFFREY